jgi:hypothetical protein
VVSDCTLVPSDVGNGRLKKSAKCLGEFKLIGLRAHPVVSPPSFISSDVETLSRILSLGLIT